MRNWLPTLTIAFAAAACGDEPKPTPKGAPLPPPTETPKPAIPAPAPVDAAAPLRVQVESDPAFEGVEWKAAVGGPFLVMQQVNKDDVRDTIRQYDDKWGAWKDVPLEGTVNPAKLTQNVRWAEKADVLARRTADLLAEVDRRFRELFVGPLKLPPLDDAREPTTVVVLWRRSNFEKAAERGGSKSGKSIDVWRRPERRQIVTFLGDEFLLSEDEIRCADEGVQKTGDQTIAAAAAAELLRARMTDEAGRRTPEWLKTGLADWIAAIEVPIATLESPAGADVRHGRIHLAHVAASRKDRESVEKWTLGQLMKPTSRADEAVLGDRIAPDHAGSMTAHFRCRAWAFCHFLWNYDDGKYRGEFVEFVRRALTDMDASAWAFAVKIMKRPDSMKWGEIEMEFEWYWNRLLERKVGPNKVTKAWYEPTTDAPTGKAQDDAEFAEYWKDRTAK